MADVKASCPRRDRTGEIVFRGVNEDGEFRECPDCSCEVAVNPAADEVLYIEEE